MFAQNVLYSLLYCKLEPFVYVLTIMAGDSSTCQVCSTKLGLLSLKRHCSKCKRICCRHCLVGRPDTNLGEGNDVDKSKICSECVENSRRSMSVHEDLEVTDQINRDLKLELKQKVMALENFRTFLLEISATFGPNSELFPNTDDKSGIDDTNCDIVDLITKCQENFGNMQQKVRLMRKEYENARKNEESRQSVIKSMNDQIESLRSERTELRNSLVQMKHLSHSVEDQKQQYQDLLAECEKLRIRCNKLEILLKSTNDRPVSISKTLEVLDDTEPSRSRILSICCPKFF
ncbi:hypothetical protein BEWA_017930 [Theileria equi strain WA]|uniref:FYVE-type domain-containing protein n=1 Tax=Theileria equi strain WA TaxID=1537102 RepID=L0ATI6_THEEQ|nr:hypothetical protein BEWA_017930 [Theileria equi strain WA]AFZ78952.1 hypothetical protein BEWA_017930 [Theileria equi strain WA]|eukprot:XP_004828618.1 hypothetical protein BEWA_017930 [Theileria equi strain WA]